MSKVSERVMHSVRMILVGGWLVLIASMFYDPLTKYLTLAATTYSPFHLNSQAACFQFQDRCLQMQPYALGARIFWGMVVPCSILILVVLGHETWRRICPLSFLSQIPRALGIQRRRRVIDASTQSVRSELVSISPDSWLGRNSIYCQFGLLFAGLNIRLLFANSDRFALGIYLLATIAAAIGVSYLYAGKTWCHYFCPMGAVQTIYTGTRGLMGTQAHQSPQPITQSMCRTIDATGTERSACVSCNSPCLDIDAERAYWDNLNAPGQKLLFYGYVGLVLGFFLYFPLYTGNWNYLSGPVWNETNQMANLFRPGFYLFDRAISIPKLLAVPLTLGGFTVASYTIGLKSERLYRGYARRVGSKVPKDLIQHRGFVIATFLAFNFLFFLGVKPTLSWMGTPGQQLASGLAIIAITMWADRSWGRSSEQYTRESLAGSFRRQLQKLGIDFSQALEGRSIEELAVDEVYVLAKTLPGVDRDRRNSIYQGLVQESLSLGQVSSAASLNVFKQLRQQLEISDREHNVILMELGVDDPNLLNPTRLVTVENQMRVSAYRQFLELLLIELVESGTPLQAAIQLKHRQILALKQEYQITPAEEAQVLAGMGQENSLFVRGAQALIGQLQTLDWRERALRDNPNDIPSIQLLTSIVCDKQQLVFGQLLAILEILGDSNESQSIVTAVANLYGAGLELIWASLAKTDDWHLRLSPQIIAGLTPSTESIAVAQSPSELETLAVLQELWQDVEPLTQAASLDAIDRLQPDLATSLAQKSIQPHPDKLVREVVQRVLGISSQSGLVPTWIADIEVKGKLHQVKVQTAQLRIGRAEDNDLVLLDPKVARYHAIVRPSARGMELHYLGSKHRVRIGSKSVHNQSVLIQQNDVLHFNTWRARTTVALQWQMSQADSSNVSQIDTLQKLTWLLQCDFFAGMKLELLPELAASGLVRNYVPGAIICQQGQPVQEILVVIGGFAYSSIVVPDRLLTARLAPATTAFPPAHSVEPTSDPPHSSELFGQVETKLPGQSIGGLPILTRSTHEFTMVAGVHGETELMSAIAISRRDFEAILDRDPLLAKQLLGILSQRLQLMTQQASQRQVNNRSNLN